MDTWGVCFLSKLCLLFRLILSVFMVFSPLESGQPVVPLDRQFLIRELNAFEESKDNTM